MKLNLEGNKYQALVESKNYTPVDASGAATLLKMFENTDAWEKQGKLVESTVSGDVAQFTPIIMPIVRRVYPNLIANEILGVQPMSMPTGYVYALVNEYLGDGVNQIDPNVKGVIVECDTQIPESVTVGSTAFTDGKVVYIEGNKALIHVGATQPQVSDKLGTANVTAIYTNEAAFGKILSGYTGTYSTAAGEQLGTDMKEIGLSILRKSLEVRTRALKARYTVEMLQDMKAQHGLLADEQLMSLIAYEMQAETDREVVNFVNGIAEQKANTTWGTTDIVELGHRWELERFRGEAIRIAKEAAMIGVETKRGQGNILLVSPRVAVMLEQVGRLDNVGADVQLNPAGGVAGTFDNRYKVIVDQYATSDYITVLYKGATNNDACGFFAPYVPLSFTRVTNPDSGQPGIIAKTRYGLTAIPGVATSESLDRARQYVKSWGIDLDNTVLG